MNSSLKNQNVTSFSFPFCFTPPPGRHYKNRIKRRCETKGKGEGRNILIFQRRKGHRPSQIRRLKIKLRMFWCVCNTWEYGGGRNGHCGIRVYCVMCWVVCLGINCVVFFLGVAGPCCFAAWAEKGIFLYGMFVVFALRHPACCTWDCVCLPLLYFEQVLRGLCHVVCVLFCLHHLFLCPKKGTRVLEYVFCVCVYLVRCGGAWIVFCCFVLLEGGRWEIIENREINYDENVNWKLKGEVKERMLVY